MPGAGPGGVVDVSSNDASFGWLGTSRAPGQNRLTVWRLGSGRLAGPPLTETSGRALDRRGEGERRGGREVVTVDRLARGGDQLPCGLARCDGEGRRAVWIGHQSAGGGDLARIRIIGREGGQGCLHLWR